VFPLQLECGNSTLLNSWKRLRRSCCLACYEYEMSVLSAANGLENNAFHLVIQRWQRMTVICHWLNNTKCCEMSNKSFVLDQPSIGLPIKILPSVKELHTNKNSFETISHLRQQVIWSNNSFEITWNNKSFETISHLKQ